jgi:aerobic carbon-monoxide dehydrogenase medium subunit
MKPAAFAYERPASLSDALTILAEQPGARLIAGGQSLGPMLNMRLATPSLLIDISRLEELKQSGTEGDAVVIGAAVRHAEFEDGNVASPVAGFFERIALGIAYRAVRNRGTIGGSLAHADPAADWPGVMVALGAELKVRSRRGVRSIEVAKLASAPLVTCLAADELIESIRLPRCSPEARTGHVKISAKPGDFAEAMAVILHDPARKLARVVISGARQLPAILPQTSQLISEGQGGAALEQAIDGDLADEALSSQAPSSYEKRLCKACALRAVTEVLG